MRRGARPPRLGRGVGGAAGFGIVLLVLVLLLIREGREKADQWSSSLSFVIAFVLFAAGVVGWWVRRLDDGAPVRDALRSAVRQQWTTELRARDLQRPKPLRLRWHAPSRPVVAAARAADVVSGELVQDERDPRPAAVALAEDFADRAVGQLVILGVKGSGKSTLAALYVLAAVDHPGPVPVLLSIAGWDPGEPIAEWLEARIAEHYPALGAGRRRAELRALIRDGGVTAVLDGLDEMPGPLRADAVRGLDRAASCGLRTMVTCRVDEYEAAVAEAGAPCEAAVMEIQPIAVEDVARYLVQRETAGSRRWTGVLAELRDNPDGPLAAGLSSPLMVSLARQVFGPPATRPADLLELTSAEAVRQRLLTGFVSGVYGPDAGRPARYLEFLAYFSRTVVRDPNLQWWELPRAVRPGVITFGVVLVSVIVSVVLSPILFFIDSGPPGAWVLPSAFLGAIVGTLAGFHASRAARRRLPGSAGWGILADVGTALGIVITVCGLGGVALLATALWSPQRAVSAGFTVQRKAGELLDDVVTGGGYLWIVGFVGVLAVTNTLGAVRGGRPQRTVLRGRTVLYRLLAGIVAGGGFGWAAMMVSQLLAPGPAPVVPCIVIAGGVGIPIALGASLSSPVDALRPPSPREVLRADRAAAVISAALVACATFAAVGLSSIGASEPPSQELMLLAYAAALGPFLVVLLGSGSSWVSYTIARVWLASHGRLPWRLTRFLADAARHGVLRQVGPAYQLRHDVVRDYLADRWPADAHRPGHASASLSWRRRLVRITVWSAAAGLLPAALAFADWRRCPEPLAVYDAAGTTAVDTLAASPDGRSLSTVVVDDQDWTVISWDLTRRRPPAVTVGHEPGPINDIYLGAAGPVVVEYYDGGAVYDVDGRRTAVPPGYDIVAATATGTHVFIDDEQGRVRVWPSDGLANGVVITAGDGPRIWRVDPAGATLLEGVWEPFPGSAAVSADGRTVATNRSGDVRVWRLQDGRLTATAAFDASEPRLIILTDWIGYTSQVALSPDGRFAATTGFDQRLQLWDARTGHRLAVVPHPACRATAVAFTGDGGRLAAGCGSVVKVWSVAGLVAAQR